MVSSIEQINALNKKEIESLLRESERRLESLNRETDPLSLTEDERVCAIANAILTLACNTNVPKAQVFAAVAGNMRISVQDAIPSSTPSEDATGAPGQGTAADEPLDDREVATPADPAVAAADEPDQQPRRLSLPSGRQPGGVRSRTAGARSRARQTFKRTGEPVSTASPVMTPASEADDAVYRHPVDASKTWNGKGSMPKWLSDAVSFGRNPEEFRVR